MKKFVVFVLIVSALVFTAAGLNAQILNLDSMANAVKGTAKELADSTKGTVEQKVNALKRAGEQTAAGAIDSASNTVGRTVSGSAQSTVQVDTVTKTNGTEQSTTYTVSKVSDQPAKKTGKASAKKVSKLVDINSASVDELKALPGMSDTYAQKIVDNRPYKAKTDLTKKKVIPKATYKKISGKIVAKKTSAK